MTKCAHLLTCNSLGPNTRQISKSEMYSEIWCYILGLIESNLSVLNADSSFIFVCSGFCTPDLRCTVYFLRTKGVLRWDQICHIDITLITLTFCLTLKCLGTFKRDVAQVCPSGGVVVLKALTATMSSSVCTGVSAECRFNQFMSLQLNASLTWRKKKSRVSGPSIVSALPLS